VGSHWKKELTRIDTFILPCQAQHIVVVAHGIFNAELIAAFLARRTDNEPVTWAHKGECKVAKLKEA
jgi:hypothetical protein